MALLCTHRSIDAINLPRVVWIGGKATVVCRYCGRTATQVLEDAPAPELNARKDLN